VRPQALEGAATYLKNIRSTLRDLGAGNSLLLALARFLSWSTGSRARLHKYFIVAQPVLAGALTPPRRGREILVSEVTAAEILATPFGRPVHVIEYRLSQGCRCIVARKDSQILGFQWFTLQDYLEDEVRCHFELREADRCAWDFDVFVDPSARTKPVFAKLWDHCNQTFRGHGISTSVSRISAFNATSLHAHFRLGARVIGWAIFLCIGSFQLAAMTARPWLHLSLSHRNVPVFPASDQARRAFLHQPVSASSHPRG
jgi:GNAT superfamily N-acetyltransferase